MGADPEPAISFVRVPAREEVPDAVGALWDAATERAGYVSNLVRAFSLRPGHLLAWQAYLEALTADEHPGLDAAERELIAVAVSALNRCDYGVAAHLPALRPHVDDPVVLHQLAHNPCGAPLPPRRRALVEFAARVTEDPAACGPEDVQRLRDAGLSDEEIFDAAEFTAFMNMANRLAAALGWRPNSERLQPVA
jgi:uncharacterized peroxidase-related enzyme